MVIMNPVSAPLRAAMRTGWRERDGWHRRRLALICRHDPGRPPAAPRPGPGCPLCPGRPWPDRGRTMPPAEPDGGLATRPVDSTIASIDRAPSPTGSTAPSGSRRSRTGVLEGRLARSAKHTTLHASIRSVTCKIPYARGRVVAWSPSGPGASHSDTMNFSTPDRIEPKPLRQANGHIPYLACR